MKTVEVIGVPMDLGADRRGVDMGPSAIRYANLHEKIRALGIRVEDMGDLKVPVPESRPRTETHLKYLGEVVKVSRVLGRVVERSVRDGHFPLVLGGDHSIAIGTLAGLARAVERPGVLWFDAHGDLNTDQTSPSGNIHGMPLAVSCELGAPALIRSRDGAPPIDPGVCAMIGVRTLDPGERENIRRLGIEVFTMYDVDKHGMREVVARALERVTRGTDAVHVSFDMDCLDPDVAPGVGTPYPGGINYREAHLAMELVAEARVITSMEVVEVNTRLDPHNRTAQLAAELVTSALGQRIL